MICCAAIRDRIRKSMWWAALIALLAGVLYLEGIPDELMTPPQASADGGSGGLPPLEVEEDAPRLEEPTAEELEKAQEAEKGADNFACFVCHVNYEGESLVEDHARAGVGCVRCHGESEAHKLDEDNITPPDRMFSADDIKPFCTQCHLTHEADAQDVIAQWQERCPHKKDPSKVTCTDCHGEHRLDSRNVRWDKETGEVLPLRDESTGGDSPGQPDTHATREKKIQLFAFSRSDGKPRKRNYREQAELLRNLGYDGTAHVELEGVTERLKALDRTDQKLFLLGIRARKPSQGPPFNHRLEEVFTSLQGRPTLVVPLFGSNPKGQHERREVKDAVAKIARKASAHDLRVALYPREGSWPGNAREALEVVQKLNCENLGVVLHLPDWRSASEHKLAPERLRETMPHLFAVVVDCANLKASAALPGLLGLMNTLEKAGYRGPVGLTFSETSSSAGVAVSGALEHMGSVSGKKAP